MIVMIDCDNPIIDIRLSEASFVRKRVVRIKVRHELTWRQILQRICSLGSRRMLFTDLPTFDYEISKAIMQYLVSNNVFCFTTNTASDHINLGSTCNFHAINTYFTVANVGVFH